jgi:hypothetical protein
MSRHTKQYREYKFKIDAFTPDTIPLSRLVEYLSDLAKVLGQDKSVHLLKIEEGSTVPVLRVEWEAEPKVRERLREVKYREAPPSALDAARSIDRRLAEDNARGILLAPDGRKVITFPGRDRNKQLVYGPISQHGEFQGVPIKIGGEKDPVPVHLEDGANKHIISARRSLAKEIAEYLFSAVIRVEGSGRWIRHADGEWELLSFQAETFRLVENADIRTNINQLRAVQAKWKSLDDPLAELERIRRGGKVQ